MGAATRALVVAALVAIGPHVASADECTGVTATGDRFATCFDLGNRLSITADANNTTSGFGAGIALRHEITFDDDPDLEWKMEHQILDSAYTLAFDAPDRFDGTFYAGRYLRHARDGHVLLPIGGGAPKKIFLPFDIGAIFEIGKLDWRHMDPTFTIGVVRVAPLVDLARSRDYKRILAIGPAMHWDMEVDRMFTGITQQRVAPFTEGLVTMRLESNDGLYVAEARVEAGTAWRSDLGWHPEARASADVERILIAIDDRPIALTAGIEYDSVRDETLAKVGLRFVLMDRTDPRVSLRRVNTP